MRGSQNAGSAVFCDKHRRAVSSSRNAQAGNEWRVKQASKASKASEEASPPRCCGRCSYPQLSLPEGFHSRHPAQRRTSAFYPVTSECGAKRVQAAVPCSPAGGWDGVFFASLPPSLWSPSSPVSLCSSLKKLKRCAETSLPSLLSTQPAGQRTGQHNTAMMPDMKKTLRACMQAFINTRSYLRFQHHSIWRSFYSFYNLYLSMITAPCKKC